MTQNLQQTFSVVNKTQQDPQKLTAIERYSSELLCSAHDTDADVLMILNTLIFITISFTIQYKIIHSCMIGDWYRVLGRAASVSLAT